MAVATTDIYGALISFFRANVGGDWWLNREPEQIDPSKRALPFNVLEANPNTEWAFGQKISEEGPVTLSCFAVTDDAVRTTANAITALLQDPASWLQIPTTGFFITEMSLQGSVLTTEDEPDKDGNIVYRYTLRFFVRSSNY